MNTKDTALNQHVAIKLTEWVTEHSDALYGYAYRFIKDASAAEDAVQDAFIAAFESFNQFESRSSPRTWLIGILRHKLLDRVRLREKLSAREVPHDYRAEEAFNNNGHWLNDSGPREWSLSPETACSNKQFSAVLNSCLEKVPEAHRVIFTLREVEGHEREAIAKQLDLTPNNVGVILHRVRLWLQQCLQKNWLKQQ